jgi:hypothetical protein
METNEPFLIGYYADGGIGSHPAILTESELLRCGFIQEVPRHLRATSEENAGKFWRHKFDEYKIFFEIRELSSIPGALACAYSDSYEWDIRGISKPLGQRIIDMIGGDNITSMDDDEGNLLMDQSDLNKVEDLIGLQRSDDNRVTLITIILDPTPNVVYWSDAPEDSHSYWMPPYSAMSLDELA